MNSPLFGIPWIQVSVTATSTCSEKYINMSRLPWPWIYFSLLKSNCRQAKGKPPKGRLLADWCWSQDSLEETDTCGYIHSVLKDSKIEKKANERVTEPAKAYRQGLQLFSFLLGSGANTENVTKVNSCSIFSPQLWKVDGDRCTKIKSLTFIPFSLYITKKWKAPKKCQFQQTTPR